ncbi:hypothetical protein [Cytobacillus oceanisediminis]|uniref:Uncharacterized protein n=1 Tax=Cytobacillus oceanisediminis TaxID=665099 RepID=A0A562JA99_9BACI|nr:hypothetical protein [Cytobacillus oceanisediminis]TWH80053.1 hypothetical protein IQ19_04768 [Cytobacillus oceanisediminis]
MEDELLFYYLFMISGIFIFLGAVYDGFRIQRQRGIMSESWVLPLILFMVGLAQPFLGIKIFSLNPSIFFLIIVLSAIIYLFIQISMKGQVFVIHETDRETLVKRIRRELDLFSIHYEEEEKLNNKEYVFTLTEEDAALKVSWRGEEKQKHIYKLSFKKWWRIYHYIEIRENIIEFYKEERDGQIFWKQILGNAGNGALILGIMIFMFFTIKP